MSLKERLVSAVNLLNKMYEDEDQIKYAEKLSEKELTRNVLTMAQDLEAGDVITQEVADLITELGGSYDSGVKIKSDKKQEGKPVSKKKDEKEVKKGKGKEEVKKGKGKEEKAKPAKGAGKDAKKGKEKETKKSSKPAKGDKELSNKAVVYLKWKKGVQDVDKLLEACNHNVKESTIKSWLSGWNRGDERFLPSIAKED